jgi:acetolactate synthase-1/3 small subunit
MEVLEPFGLIEFVRSARIAIIKESKGIHDKVKEMEAREPSEVVMENEYLNENEKVFSM